MGLGRRGKGAWTILWVVCETISLLCLQEIVNGVCSKVESSQAWWWNIWVLGDDPLKLLLALDFRDICGTDCLFKCRWFLGHFWDGVSVSPACIGVSCQLWVHPGLADEIALPRMHTPLSIIELISLSTSPKTKCTENQLRVWWNRDVFICIHLLW